MAEGVWADQSVLKRAAVPTLIVFDSRDATDGDGLCQELQLAHQHVDGSGPNCASVSRFTLYSAFSSLLRIGS